MSKAVRGHIAERLLTQKQQGSLRQLKSPSDSLIDFASNDYLGLARSRELFEMIEAEVHQHLFRNGSTGSRLLTGNSRYTEETEKYLAEFFQGDASLLLNSGYAANTAVLSALPQRGDTILYDDRSHASIKDGARLSMATRFSFRHNDLNDLETKITNAGKGNLFVVVESVYSMDGDESPLPELVDLCEKHDACLILDEAHSTGVEGPAGKGMAVKYNLQERIPIRVYTFGKGMGVHGACVVGSRDLRDYLVNFARPFIYTTALSPHCVAAIRCSFRFLESNPMLQAQLKTNIYEYQSRTNFLAGKMKNNSPIQTYILQGNDEVRAASLRLLDHGIDVRPILSPTVPKGQERLRICLHAFNTSSEIIALTDQLRSVDQERKIVSQ